MVRAHMKQTPDEKKDTHKKKAPSKKKAETGQWPCKINGCNKVFAREADLKRHQRTTKLHSMPGFACPQCDATFTRTDALRRHQKSRHNGVVIPPAEQEKGKSSGDTDSGSPASKSPSPSATPARGQSDSTSTKNASTSAAQPGSGGPGNYYRQHTMTTYPPRPHPGMLMEQHYPSSIGPPTSAARLHQANWHPPPWPPEGPPPPGMYHPMAPPPPGHYYSPYYRPPPGMIPFAPPPHYMPMGPEFGHPPHLSPNGMPYPPPPNGPPRPHAPEGAGSSADGASQGGKDSDVEMEDGASQASAPVIDPSLEQPTEALHPSAAQARKAGADTDAEDNAKQRQLAEAAVKAVLEYQEAQAKRAASSRAVSQASEANEDAHGAVAPEQQPGSEKSERRTASPAPQSSVVSPGRDIEDDGEADSEASSRNGGPRHTEAERNGSLPHELSDIVTEDGVTMLNPAELLTQESLASPPPS